MSNYKRTIITLKPENDQIANGNKKPIGTLLIEEKGGVVDSKTSGKVTATLQNLKPNSMYYLYLIAPLKGICNGVKICNIFSDSKGQASVKVDINIYDVCSFGIPLSSFTVVAIFENTMKSTMLTGYTGDIILWKGTFVDLSTAKDEHHKDENHKNENHKDEHRKDEHHKDEYHKDEHHKDEHHKDEHHKEEHHKNEHRKDEHHKDEYHKDEHHKDEHHKDEHHKNEHHKDEHHKDEHHKNEHHKDEHHKNEHHKDEHHKDEHHKENSLHKTNTNSLPLPNVNPENYEEIKNKVSHDKKEIEFQIPEVNKITPNFSTGKSENKYHKNFNNSLKAYRRERNKNFNSQNNKNINNSYFDQFQQPQLLNEVEDCPCTDNVNALNNDNHHDDNHYNNNNHHDDNHHNENHHNDNHNNNNHHDDNHHNENHHNDNHNNNNHHDDNHNNNNHHDDNHNNNNHHDDNHNNNNHHDDNHHNDNHHDDNHNNDNHNNNNHHDDNHNNDNHHDDNQNNDNHHDDNHNNDNHHNDNHNNDNHHDDNHNNDNHHNDNHNNDNHHDDNHNNSTVHSKNQEKTTKKYQELSEIISNTEPVSPFKNQSKNVRWVRFSDEKFNILPEKMNYLKDSHFVELNLFANHHFLVGQNFDANGPKFIFAMPAYYDRNTRLTANNLGFVQFKCCDNIRAIDGIAGYWLMPII